mgnify:CR=1 FL=1
MPLNLSELALRALGVSEALIQEIYGLDPAELRSVLDCALEQGTEARFNASTHQPIPSIAMKCHRLGCRIFVNY